MSFTLRPITPDDFPRMVEIINTQVREPATVDDLLREERHRTADSPFLRLGAVTEEGILAGFGLAEGGPGHRPGELWVRVRVDQPYQGQGIGRALYDQILAYARSQGASRLESAVREDHPQSVTWAERRGFIREYHLFESTLSLPDFDPAPFREAVARAEGSGIRFTTLAAEIKEGDRIGALQRYYQLSFRLARDIPGLEDRPDYPWDRWLDWVLNDPTWKDELILLAADGERWVALCKLGPQNSGALYNNFTAVDQEYRGRGIAMAIKLLSLELAKSLGAPYIRTNNHSVNQPMLAINQRLGYQPLPGVYQIAAHL